MSAVFIDDGAKISHTVPDGFTFYLLEGRLMPISDTVASGINASAIRRAHVEITFDGVAVDVVSHDHMSSSDAANEGASGGGTAWQNESGLIDSMDGDGVKKVIMTAINTQGMYRVSLLGIEEPTGQSPAL